jgi:hypothetical protein
MQIRTAEPREFRGEDLSASKFLRPGPAGDDEIRGQIRWTQSDRRAEFVALRHEIPSGRIEFRGAATKLRVAVTNFVACCHEIPRARLVVLGGRLMILE